MEREKEIDKKAFIEAILDGAMEDLRKCGLDEEEISSIIEEQFAARFTEYPKKAL
jgi:hypothetical protein